MARPYSLDKSLGTSTATRLHFIVNDKVPDPTLRAHSFDSLDDLVGQLPPGDARAVIDFVDEGTALPFDVLTNLRNRFSAEQLAGLLHLDNPKVNAMNDDTTPPPARPADQPMWRVSDSVWCEAESLLDRLNPPKASATKRMDQRMVLDAVVNKALSGAGYTKMRQFGNPITISQTCDRWYIRDAFRPLIDLLTRRCPELADADWSRSLTKAYAEKFRGGKPQPIAAPKQERDRTKRQARRVESGNIAERFGVQVQPTPLGRVTVGALVVDLFFDPRPAHEVAPARHVYGGEQRIVFASTAGVGDIGKAIGTHLAKALDQQVGESRRRA